MRKPTFWFPTWSDTNQAVQLQKMARGLKFRIVEGLYHLCSDNKGADLICVFVFTYAKCWFSHDAPQMSSMPNVLNLNYNRKVHRSFNFIWLLRKPIRDIVFCVRMF